ncbi:immunoglobulin superfamily member 11-like isoform X2 [Trachinotus anak]|uniref:immunoglobulin superfamily member 11-like isoform X2 n=1 Tax=Trachinotus anak TaxID=443729 RepID=UPI0039F1CF52
MEKINHSLSSSVFLAATLTVLPNRSQFFLYESVSLSCGQQGNSSDWTVKRNISPEITEDCPRPTDRRNESHCFIDDIYPLDTGVYWCESAAGKCSNTVNITVTGSVILESPVLPEMEGDDVTLRCRNRTTSSSSLTTDFYKDQLFIGSSSTGNITIHSVSKSDEGLYRCHISGAGGSPGSWLTVRARHPEAPQSSLTHILLPVAGVCLLLAVVMLFFFWRHRKDATPLPSLDDLSRSLRPLTSSPPPAPPVALWEALQVDQIVDPAVQ